VSGVGEGGGSSLRFLLAGSVGNCENGVAKLAPILPWRGVLPAKVEDSAKKEVGDVGTSSGHSGAVNLKLVSRANVE
jgi:hypothetical protein